MCPQERVYQPPTPGWSTNQKLYGVDCGIGPDKSASVYRWRVEVDCDSCFSLSRGALGNCSGSGLGSYSVPAPKWHRLTIGFTETNHPAREIPKSAIPYGVFLWQSFSMLNFFTQPRTETVGDLDAPAGPPLEKRRRREIFLEKRSSAPGLIRFEIKEIDGEQWRYGYDHAGELVSVWALWP
jgi:hypothetical protein